MTKQVKSSDILKVLQDNADKREAEIDQYHREAPERLSQFFLRFAEKLPKLMSRHLAQVHKKEYGWGFEVTAHVTTDLIHYSLSSFDNITLTTMLASPGLAELVGVCTRRGMFLALERWEDDGDSYGRVSIFSGKCLSGQLHVQVSCVPFERNERVLYPN